MGDAFLRCAIDEQGCVLCGGKDFERRLAIDDALAAAWELGERERAWFDEREGHACRSCGMSRRVRMLLWAVHRLAPDLDQARVLHVNQINRLQPALRCAAELVETTYLPDQPRGVEINGLINQNLDQLTFADNCFDLVLHSETLEHLDDFERALSEIDRVLKPGGRQIYTVPLLHGRRSRRRARRTRTGEVTHLLPPSYHGCEAEYLVFWELGGDFLRFRPAIEGVFYDDFAANPTVFAVSERKLLA